MKNLLFSVLTTIVFFIMIELTLLLFGIIPVGDLRKQSFGKDGYKINKALIKEFEGIGGRAYTLKNTILYLYKPYKSQYYNINSLGFRGSEINSFSSSQYRIMLMGGSTVFGAGVSDVDTIPAMLGGLLKQCYPNMEITVFNLGIEGYGFKAEIALAKKMESELKPNLIIFYHGYNDFVDQYYGRKYNGIENFTYDKSTHFEQVNTNGKDRKISEHIKSIIEYIRFKISEYSRLYALLSIIKQKVIKTFFDSKEKTLFIDEEFNREYIEDMNNISSYFNKKRIKTIFIKQPFLATKRKKTLIESKYFLEWEINKCDLEKSYLYFVKQSTKSLPNVFDFTKIFDDYSDNIYWDIAHMNNMGNNIVAKNMLKVIEQNNIFPKTSSRCININ